MQFAPNFYIKKSFFYFFWPIQKSFFWLLQKILWLQPNIWYYLKRKHAIGFYKQNAHRVDAAMNMLADKKSKDIYLGVIRFIQTQNIRDYAFYPVEEDQYFFKKLRFNTNEVFIDCGAYTGDTIDCFLRHCNKYKQIIAFEP
ncbi:MAG: hypothetical protein LBG64_01755, partial [Pseudomonadales bacterium]|nr:hypothetical protein [Pseudomonadales bacterium]